MKIVIKIREQPLYKYIVESTLNDSKCLCLDKESLLIYTGVKRLSPGAERALSRLERGEIKYISLGKNSSRFTVSLNKQ